MSEQKKDEIQHPPPPSTPTNKINTSSKQSRILAKTKAQNKWSPNDDIWSDQSLLNAGLSYDSNINIHLNKNRQNDHNTHTHTNPYTNIHNHNSNSRSIQNIGGVNIGNIGNSSNKKKLNLCSLVDRMLASNSSQFEARIMEDWVKDTKMRGK